MLMAGKNNLLIVNLLSCLTYYCKLVPQNVFRYSVKISLYTSNTLNHVVDFGFSVITVISRKQSMHD